MYEYLAQIEVGGFIESVKTLTSLGGGTVIAVVCYLLIKGELVRKGELNEMKKQRDDAIAQRDRWCDTAFRSIGNTERAQKATEVATGLAVTAVQTTAANRSNP